MKDLPEQLNPPVPVLTELPDLPESNTKQPDINDSSIHVFTADKRDAFRMNGVFYNRSTNRDCLCVILAGHKPFLTKYVFERIRRYAPNWVDICVVSSGVFKEELQKLCEANGWSYLSSEENNICLIQNKAIDLHPLARYIFKIDEDMFITKNFFERIKAAYHHAQLGGFRPGVLAPMITLNCYTSRLLLEKFNLLSEFETLFQKPLFVYDLKGPWFRNVEIARFFWGKGNYLPSLDEMDKIVSQQPQVETPSPIRFNIGAIMFERKLWEDMHYFTVKRNEIGMGEDERNLNYFCYFQSRPIMISENVVVGHFSYSPQTEGMKEYLMNNTSVFLPPEN